MTTIETADSDSLLSAWAVGIVSKYNSIADQPRQERRERSLLMQPNSTVQRAIESEVAVDHEILAACIEFRPADNENSLSVFSISYI